MSRKDKGALAAAVAFLVHAVAAQGMDYQCSGQFNLRGGHADSDWEGSAELRLMPEIRPGDAHLFLLHYEAAVLLGQVAFPPGDASRLFDLTGAWHDDDDRLACHRLDRLNYQYTADWGTLTLGREAITWGNGIVFNPIDLFNPFAPTDVERDYKLGDDLVLLSLHPASWNGHTGWQLLLVPRRDPVTGSLQAKQSSLALKGHLFAGEGEWDFLAAWHFDEAVVGLGRIGYLGNAVWRWDAILTFAEGDHHLFSTVANIDYSWNWDGLNYYGSLEFHYNTIGSPDYAGLAGEPLLLVRLARGEVFTLGRAYLAPSLQIELHPLVNLHLSAVLNLQDPSAVVLPRLIWNFRQDMEFTLGGATALGGPGTEFGGLRIPGFPEAGPDPDRLYLWLKAWF
ncbi:MAG: hypothetical protein ACP5I4_01085 [Oceanipulchritudo sp.]